jgi:hypothetical protein
MVGGQSRHGGHVFVGDALEDEGYLRRLTAHPRSQGVHVSWDTDWLGGAQWAP